MDDAAPALELVGSLDGLNAEGSLTGWLWCAAEPTVRREIVMLADGVEVARGVADQPRPDLTLAGVGDGGHAFSIRVPPSAIPPGGSAELVLRDGATGQSVGEPTAVASVQLAGGSTADAGSGSRGLSGNLDQVTNDGWITGWCWYPTAPELRVALEIVIDGAPVGTAIANLPRPDLAGAGIGDGAYGFSYAVPWPTMAAAGTLTVTVRDAASGGVVGVPVTLRMGLRAGEEDRVADLERQLRMLRAEVALHGEQARGRDEDRAARDLFRTVAAFFQELADTPVGTGFLATGLRGVVADFADRHAQLSLAVPRAPTATILLLADSPPEGVHRALASLIATGADRLADIVLLDGGAGGPEMVLMPSVVANLRYRRVGASAVAARNEAGAGARSPVVVFLSACVVATEGWLDALLATLDAEPECDVVAARITAADGTVESAGLHVGPDLDPVPFVPAGRRPVLQTVDAAVDGAVALRRTLFEAAGGLALAYDDPQAALVDLCLTARAAGRRVTCQPRADLLRPTDAPGWAPLEAEPRARLRRRWREASVPATVATYVGHALFVDGTLPRPDRDAGSLIHLRLAWMLRDLGWHVTFAAVEARDVSPSEVAALELRGIAVLRPGKDGSVTDFLRAEGTGLGLVVVCRYMHAALLFERIADLAPAAARVFVPADLHFLREARAAELLGPAAAQLSGRGMAEDGAAQAASETRAQELACVARADATLLHSDHELALLAKIVPREKLHLLRWSVEPAADVPSFAGRRGICFVGSFLHPPNADGVLWFADAVMPILRRKRPGLVVSIVGADPPERVAALSAPDFFVRGWVADLEAVLGQVRLTIAPLRFGAGFKGKVATSLAVGVPVVATAIAVEGTGLRNGDGVLVADDARAFAAAILRLHDDDALWSAQSERALAACRALYSPEAGRAVWRGLLTRLGRPFRAR